MRRGSPAPPQAKMTTKSKAAEAVLHDADARFAMPLHIGEAFGVRLSFLALSDAVTMFLCALYSQMHIANAKAAEGQPHSTPLAPGSNTPRNCVGP